MNTVHLQIAFDPDIVMLIGIIVVGMIAIAICDEDNGLLGKWRWFLGGIGVFLVVVLNTINQLKP